MIQTFNDILQTAKTLGPKLIAVAAAEDADVLQAVQLARDYHIAKAILIGDEEKILSIAKQHDISLADCKIINIPDPQAACMEAVRLVSSKQADILMKGMVDTKVILKAVLNKEIGLRTDNVLSHVVIAELEHFDRLLFISDSAMNIAPDVKTKKQIIENIVGVVHDMGNSRPNVAIVCAVEKVNPNMPATLDAQELVRMNEADEITGCCIAGPLALDNAISVEAARHKKIDHPVAGKADILIMPNIEAGNILYKSISFLALGKVAGLIVGAKAPIVLTSRADSDITKLYSIASAVLMSK